jgi:prophage regulatory protein
MSNHQRRIIRPKQAWTRAGFGRSNFYDRIARGLYVRPIKLGSRASGIVEIESDILLDASISGRSDDEIREIVRRLEAARHLPTSKREAVIAACAEWAQSGTAPAAVKEAAASAAGAE